MYLVSPCVLVDDSTLRIAASLHPPHCPVSVLIWVVEGKTNSVRKLRILVHRAKQGTNQGRLARPYWTNEDNV